MLTSNSAVCGQKKSRLVKSQEKTGLLSKLGIRTPFSYFSLIGDVFYKNSYFVLIKLKMISLI